MVISFLDTLRVPFILTFTICVSGSPLAHIPLSVFISIRKFILIGVYTPHDLVFRMENQIGVCEPKANQIHIY